MTNKTLSLCFFCLTFIQSFAQHAPKRELRAAWIATVVNIDWPTQKGLPANRQQAEYVELLNKLQEIGMNAVIVQVRPVADSFYPSDYAPWSEYLSGVQGRHPEPYYNPLTFMIGETKKRGMEFHAWFNPYRVSMNGDFNPAPGHPFLTHPEWFLQYGGRWYFDPGHPDGREYVLRGIMETVRHYDIDAVHFDDYFYPYRIAGQEFPDSVSYATFGAGQFPVRDDWRRDNVDYFVSELASRINTEKPHVKFGISPFGVWRNIDRDPRGSNTRAGQTNYDDLYADVLKWLEEGWIDYITPQLYWHIGFERAEYKTLVDWWAANAHGRHVYIGQGIYRVGEKGWENPNEIVNQIAYNRQSPAVQGSMFFSAKVFSANKKGVNTKVDSLYRSKALIPAMPWKKAEALYPPNFGQISGAPATGLTLRWTDDDSPHTSYYVIYRFPGDVFGGVDDPSAIVAIVPREPSSIQEWTDKTADKRKSYTYAITGADRLHNESAAGRTLTIRTKGAKKSVMVKL